MGLHGLLANHSQKKEHKKITFNYHYFYIGLSLFNLPLSHMLHATANILLYKLLNTNIHNTTLILPQVHIYIKNSPVFLILSKLHLFLPLLWVQLLI